MNNHECVSCADDVNKHGDVQVKRLGRLASIDNCQPHSYLQTNILHVWLNICKPASILQIRLNMILKESKSERKILKFTKQCVYTHLPLFRERCSARYQQSGPSSKDMSPKFQWINNNGSQKSLDDHIFGLCNQDRGGRVIDCCVVFGQGYFTKQ